MRVKVISYIPGKQNITGEYQLAAPMGIVSFINGLGVIWNHEALVMVNQGIVNDEYQLLDGDEIHLLIPILGG